VVDSAAVVGDGGVIGVGVGRRVGLGVEPLDCLDIVVSNGGDGLGLADAGVGDVPIVAVGGKLG